MPEGVPLRLQNSFFSELETSENPVFEKKSQNIKKLRNAEKPKKRHVRFVEGFSKPKLQ